MVEFVGLIKIKKVKGSNLAVRDIRSSDPYVILSLGSQVSLLVISNHFLIQKVNKSKLTVSDKI